MKYSIIILLLFTACSDYPPEFISDTDSESDTDSNTESETDACDDIVCNDLPDDECVDDGSLKQYTGEATCIDGECNYSYEIIECEWGCLITEKGESCGPYPCDDVICNDPPPGYCEEEKENNTEKAYNYQKDGFCNLDKENQPYCTYYYYSIDTCDPDSAMEPRVCKVIDNVAQCVKK